MNDPLGLGEFSLAALTEDAAGQPLSLPVNKIDFNPDNIRDSIDADELAELAQAIKTQGLLQPILVRENPDKPGRYLVNVGERRLRAVRLLGWTSIDAIVRNNYSVYHVAAENIHRAQWTPMEASRFIAAREAEGASRAQIARELGKPREYVLEVADLVRAKPNILRAYASGRLADSRAIYLLNKANETRPHAVRELLKGDRPLTRAAVESALAAPWLPAQTAPPAATEKKTGRLKTAAKGKPWNALAVQVKGRKGYLALRAAKSRERADVVFEDGSTESVALASIKLTAWTRT